MDTSSDVVETDVFIYRCVIVMDVSTVITFRVNRMNHCIALNFTLVIYCSILKDTSLQLLS